MMSAEDTSARAGRNWGLPSQQILGGRGREQEDEGGKGGQGGSN